MKNKIFWIILISLFIFLSTKNLLSKQVPIADTTLVNTNDPSNTQPANPPVNPTSISGYSQGGGSAYGSAPSSSGSLLNGISFGIAVNSDGTGYTGFTNNPFLPINLFRPQWNNLIDWNTNLYGHPPANPAFIGNSGTWVNLENTLPHNMNTPSINTNTINPGDASNQNNTITPGDNSNTTSSGNNPGLNGTPNPSLGGMYNNGGLSTTFSSNNFLNGMQNAHEPSDSANIYGAVMPFGSLSNNSFNIINISNWCWQPCYCSNQSNQASNSTNVCWCWFPCWCWVYNPQAFNTINNSYSGSPPVPNVPVPNVPATL